MKLDAPRECFSIHFGANLNHITAMIEANQKYVRIPLGKDKYAVISIEDLPEIGKFRWSKSPNGATRTLLKSESPLKKVTMSMHRQIMNPPDGMCVDHIDRNVLNNTRENLRICTALENAWNRKPQKRKSIGTKGVIQTGKKLWRVEIVCNKQRIHVGTYDSPEKSALAYSEASIKYHGEYGRVEETPFQDYSDVPIAPRANNRPTTSGHFGVIWNYKKWTVSLVINGKTKTFGSFEKKEDAIAKVKTLTNKSR